MTKLEEMLIQQEGMRLKPYKDSEGKLTIGVGNNIQDDGITKEEALFMMRNDIANVKKELSKFSWFTELNADRKDVIIDMAFNLGVPRLLYFEKMIDALRKKDYDKAADEMLSSNWAYQVKGRAQELANIMRRGEYLYDV